MNTNEYSENARRVMDSIEAPPGPRLWPVSLTAEEWAEVLNVVKDHRDHFDAMACPHNVEPGWYGTRATLVKFEAQVQKIVDAADLV
jgi:hypothetical protein